MSEIKYEIVKKIGVLSSSASGWSKELNLISWNDRDPKYDVRFSSPKFSSIEFGGGRVGAVRRSREDGQRRHPVQRRVVRLRTLKELLNSAEL